MGSRLLLMICVLLGAGARDAAAGTEEDAGPRRWGIGWDRGIALRYRPEPGWGLGVRINPDILDDDRTEPDLDRELTRESDDLSLSFGFLAYREAKLGTWVRLGPYSELSFTYEDRETTYDQIEPDRVLHDFQAYRLRTWRWEVGLRPAFAIEDRFVLETRFGLALIRRDGDREESRRSERNGEIIREFTSGDSQSWELDSLGTNLGFGSVLQFIIYL